MKTITTIPAKISASLRGIAASALVMAFAISLVPTSAQAFWFGKGGNSPGSGYSGGSQLSDALDVNGFETLLFALDTTGLTSVLDSNRVTLFAPTNDVFDATAEALGCEDALDLATRLANIPVGDSNALVAVLSHHAVLKKISSSNKLLDSSPLQTANGDNVTTGVNSGGLYVLGAANDPAAPANITVEEYQGRRWAIYPVNAILLPFAPPSDLCD